VLAGVPRGTLALNISFKAIILSDLTLRRLAGYSSRKTSFALKTLRSETPAIRLFFRCRAVVAVVAIAITLVACYGVTQVTFNDNLADIFKADNPDYRRLEQFFDEFGADDKECVIVLRSADLFSRQSVAVLRRLVDGLAALRDVERVSSILDARRPAPGLLRRLQIPLIPRDDADDEAFRESRDRALKHPLVAGRMLSEDGTTMLLSARLAGEALSAAEIQPAVERIRTVLDRSVEGSDVGASMTGLPQLRADIYHCVRREEIRFTMLGALVAVCIAVYLFRRPAAVLIVSVPPLLGTLWTVGALGLAGEPINTLNSILPALVMVVGFTDAVHFMMDIRRGRSQGRSPMDAAAVSLRHLFLPCFLTSVTTAIGFGSLAVAQIDVIQRFGVACAVGAMLNFVAVVPLVPLLASTRLGNHVSDADSRTSTEVHAHRGLSSLVGWLTREARLIAVLAVLVTLNLLALTTRLEPENSIYSGIPDGSESYASLRHCDDVFGGALYSYVIVHWPDTLDLDSPPVLQAMADVHNLLGRQSELGTPFSVMNLLVALPHRKNRLGAAVKYLELAPAEAVNRLVRRDLRKAVVNVQTPDQGARAMGPVYAALEKDLERLEDKYPGFELQLTGSTVVASRNVNLMIVDLSRSLALAAVVIFAVMSIAFRSVGFGLLSVLPNVFPLVCAASALVFTGGAMEMAAVTTFSICLGIAVDDTIHLISRYRLERNRGQDTAVAVQQAAGKVGAALAVTTLTLIGGFGSGFLSDLPAMRLFSLLSCIALVAALVAAVVILPALLVCFDSKRPRQAAARPRPLEVGSRS